MAASMQSGDTLTVPGPTDPEPNMGYAYSWPVITITATTKLEDDIVLTNNTTGAIWTYDADLAASKALVVDMENHTVTNDGSDDIANVDTSSDWWVLKGGVANEIQLDFAGGAVDAALSIVYYRRYYNL